MVRTRFSYLTCLILLFSLVTIFSPAPLLASGNAAEVWTAFNQVPPIYDKGVIYTSPYLTFTTSPGAAPDPSSLISLVSYTWAFNGQNPPAGTVVKLCDYDSSTQQRTSLDISNIQSGVTYYFQSLGLSAYTANFYLTFEVPGQGFQYPNLYPSNTD